MKCNAILFNLESLPSRRNAQQTNQWLTFVDEDDGQSHRVFVDDAIARQYSKMKPVTISMSVSAGVFNNQPQMNIRILDMRDRVSETVPSRPSSVFPGAKVA